MPHLSHQVQYPPRQLPEGGRVHGTLKIPATAVRNNVTGDWEETDPHRLAQRRKQLCFGKVTKGYTHYTRKVQLSERQEGNDMHPHTPKLNQVCSKRSWDCQVGQWRRTLHYWDSDPDPVDMRKEPAELKSLSEKKTIQPRYIVVNQQQQSTQPTVKVKYVIKGENEEQCQIFFTPLQTSMLAFTGSLEEKTGTILSLYFIDQDNDCIEIDDDVSLRDFLDTITRNTFAGHPPPKLFVELLAATAADVATALSTLSTRIPKDQLGRMSLRWQRANVPHRAIPCTPAKANPIPDLVDIVTPTPEGETPAMKVFHALMEDTPEPSGKERRKLFAE
eukprot:TRINITY_DN31139_c0_g1_i1.p1 TRINITY_DN31139_c0_g1~~TRINITY_DN31139_c0_g1_i1.p1  ORF type:complete len:333 (+),score=51.96 TRINITY_DN31139_c0_g1_i1:55-1053(+)